MCVLTALVNLTYHNPDAQHDAGSLGAVELVLRFLGGHPHVTKAAAFCLGNLFKVMFVCSS